MQLEGSDHQCSFRRTIENMIHSLAPSLLFHFSQVSSSPSFVIPTLFCESEWVATAGLYEREDREIGVVRSWLVGLGILGRM